LIIPQLPTLPLPPSFWVIVLFCSLLFLICEGAYRTVIKYLPSEAAIGLSDLIEDGKTGGRLIRHARYFTLQLAESYLTRLLFRQIVARIAQLAWHPT